MNKGGEQIVNQKVAENRAYGDNDLGRQKKETFNDEFA
jgi:hypothetical protein